MKTLRSIMHALAALALCLILAAPALALDRITLRNGKVVEGEITKESDGVVFINVLIGKLRHPEIYTADQILRIERNVDAAADTNIATTAPAGLPKTAPAEQKPASPEPSSGGPTRVTFISLEEMVGPYLNADALQRSVDLAKPDKPDIIVLVINSGGGALAEVPPLSEFIHDKMKKEYRVVGWIRSAISAASLTVFNCEEIYMMREGNVGGTVAYVPGGSGGGNKAIEGTDLERVLKLGELISKRGKRNPLIMRAMQIFMELSADIDENGNVTWYEGTRGRHIVNPEDRILTFNSVDAEKYKVSKGTADTKEELLRLMGVKEWVEVGQKADQYQQEFRANVRKFSALAEKTLSEFDLAMSAANGAGADEKLRNMYIGRARARLQELQSAVRKAPSYEKYSQFNKEWFEEMYERLRKMAQPRN